MKKLLIMIAGFFSWLFLKEKGKRKELEKIIKREKEGQKIEKENKEKLENMAINDLVSLANGVPDKPRKGK